MPLSPDDEKITLSELFRRLGVGFSANEVELRKAFYGKQRIHHPDKGGNEEVSRKLNEAYKILTDKDLRAQYDFGEDVDDYGNDTDNSNKKYLNAGHLKSKALKTKISNWIQEFKHTLIINDNFSASFLTIVKEILDKAGPPLREDHPDYDDTYYCNLCDRRFKNFQTHYEHVVRGYIGVIFGENEEEFDYQQNSIYALLRSTFGEEIYDCQCAEFSQEALREYWSSTNNESLLLGLTVKRAENMDWYTAAFDALKDDEFDTAIMSLKALSMIDNEIANLYWDSLGLKMYEKDPVRAHVCFLSGCYDLNYIADEFFAQDNHEAAISYYLHINAFDKIFQRGTTLLTKNQQAGLKYFAALLKIMEEIDDDTNMVVGKLIEIVNILYKSDKSLLEKMYQAIINTFPETFEDPISFPIHRYFIDKAKSVTNVENGKFILAAAHFSEETGIRPSFVSSFSQQVVQTEMYFSPYLNLMTLKDILPFANSYSVSILENYLSAKTNFLQFGNEMGACLYLVRGTVNKIRGNWLEALEDFQKSFEVSAVAIDIRVEIISTLFQCTHFHENILLEILNNMESLKGKLQNKELIDFKQLPFIFSSIFPSPISKMPNIFQPTSNLRTLKKNETQIEARLRNAVDAALYYYDLSDAVSGAESVVGVLLMSMSKFMEAISTTEDPALIFSYKNAISEIFPSVYVLSLRYTNPFICTYVSRMIISILLSANQILSNKLTFTGNYSERASSFQKALITFKKMTQKIDIFSSADVEFSKIILEGYLDLAKINPLVTTKMHSAFDLLYLDLIGTRFLEKFWNQKIENNEFSAKLPFHLFAYHRFDGVWHRWFKGVEFEEAKIVAMEALLETKGWNIDQVADIMDFPLIRRDEDGWLHKTDFSLDFEVSEEVFSTVDGFEINMDTGIIKLLFSSDPPRMNHKNLFSLGDVKEIFEKGITWGFFTLDEPDSKMPAHPFYNGRYGPKEIRGSNFLSTMAWVDMLLKQFSLGVEINSNSYFEIRKSDESLLKRLPPHLKEIVTPLADKRDRSTLYESAHRFWVDFSVDEIEMSAKEDGTTITYKFGKVPVAIKKHLLKRDEDGELVDDVENDSDDTVEARFAKDFSKNYYEIGKYFPELLRLTELMKLALINKLLMGIYGQMKTDMKKYQHGTEFYTNTKKSLQDLFISLPHYPQCNESRVSSEMSETLALNGVTRRQVAPDELTRVENHIRSQLNQCDQNLASQVRRQLVEAFHIPESQVNVHLVGALTGQPLSRINLIDKCIQYLSAYIIAKKERVCQSIAALNINPDRNAETLSEDSEPECCWYPAAFLSKNIEKTESLSYFVRTHGGVVMNIGGVRYVPTVNTRRTGFKSQVTSSQIASSNSHSRSSGSSSGPSNNNSNGRLSNSGNSGGSGNGNRGRGRNRSKGKKKKSKSSEEVVNPKLKFTADGKPDFNVSRKVGLNGDPMWHFPQCKSLKEARERAKQNSKGGPVLEDKAHNQGEYNHVHNTRKGFTTKKGEQVPNKREDGVHFIYGKKAGDFRRFLKKTKNQENKSP